MIHHETEYADEKTIKLSFFLEDRTKIISSNDCKTAMVTKNRTTNNQQDETTLLWGYMKF